MRSYVAGMALKLKWVGEDELDRVAETRHHCYAAAEKELDHYKSRIRNDGRGKVGDFMIAESSDGQAVGTITSLAMDMWVRGGRIPCQGIAYVGTIKTHRRRGGSERGIATQLMDAALKLGRERGDVVSALMPFRASFYEHFGYGMVERRALWNVPISVLPHGEFDGFRFMRDGDLPQVKAARQRQAKQGQCEIERGDGGWSFFASQWENGLCVVDQPTAGGPIASWFYFVEVEEAGKTIVRVIDWTAHSGEALLRALHFFASMRDQYTSMQIELPADLCLNYLLQETQLPHRQVEHAHAAFRTVNRLQLRVLDHARFLEALSISDTARSGSAVVAVREAEGHVSTFKLDLNGGRFTVASSDATPDVECADTIWAPVACGELPATVAAKLGLIKLSNPRALAALDALSFGGPVPFCNERF